MAREHKVGILVKLQDEASKGLKGITEWSLPKLAKNVLATGAAFASVHSVVGFFTSSIKKAMEAEVAVAKLSKAVSNLGVSSDLIVPALQAQATAMARATQFTTAEVMAVQKVLISVGHLSGKTLDDATKAVLDFAAGMGKDATEAAMDVAKAAMGVTRTFSRLGFEFKKGASDGEVLQTVIDGIRMRFSGAASADMDTYTGKIRELGEEWGRLKKAVGELALEAGSKNMLDGMRQAVEDLTGALKLNISQWKELALVFFAEHGRAPIQKAAMDALQGSESFMKAPLEEENRRWLQALIEGESDRVKMWDAQKQRVEKAAAAAEAAAKRAKAAQLKAENEAELVDSSWPTGDAKPLLELQPNVSAQIQELREAMNAIQPKVTETKTALEQLGIMTVPEVTAKVKLLQEAWEATKVSMGEATDPAQIRKQREEIVRQADALRAETGAKVEGIPTEQKPVPTWLDTTLYNEAADAATRFSDTLIDGAMGAKVNWGDFFKQLIADFIKAIARAVILNKIMSGINSQGGGQSGGTYGMTWGGSGTGGWGGSSRTTYGNGFPGSTPSTYGSVPRLSGAGAGGNVINISALDGLSVRRVLVDRGDDLIAALDRLARRGRYRG